MTNFQSHTLKVWTRRITNISVCTHRGEAAGVPGCYSLASLIQNRNDNRFKGLSGLGFGVIESAHAGFLSFLGICKDAIFITSVQIFLLSFSFAKVLPFCAAFMRGRLFVCFFVVIYLVFKVNTRSVQTLLQLALQNFFGRKFCHILRYLDA